MLSGDEDFIVAFQRQQLIDIRDLFNELDIDLDQLLSQEEQTAAEISALQSEAETLRTGLDEVGTDVGTQWIHQETVPDEDATVEVQYRRLEAIKPDQYEDLSSKAREYLEHNGVDLDKDPLLQILTTREISDIAERYRQQYGDVSWSKADYLVVMAAGAAATLVDIFLVGLPPNPLPGLIFNSIPSLQPSKGPGHFVSPVTKKIREYSPQLYEYFKKLEKKAKVPFDGRYPKDVDWLVDGLRPKLHRLMSLGHDPGLIIIGVLDTMSGKGTYIDKYGKVIVVPKEGYGPVGFIEAFSRVFLHLLSDMFTPMGIPPPFLSLLQLVPGESPFVIKGGSRVHVSWTDLARYMYANGYDFRHFLAMGLVPATIEAVIRAYWLYYSFENKEQAEKERLKLVSMLLMGHMLATAGNVVKIGIVSSMVGPESAPLAINWAELLKLAPVTVAFFTESLKRDIKIRSSLDAEWLSIYRDINITD